MYRFLLDVDKLTLSRRVLVMTMFISSFVPVDDPLTIIIKENFPSNSEADASELLENPEEMFPRYYTHSVVCISFKSSSTRRCATRRERIKFWTHTWKYIEIEFKRYPIKILLLFTVWWNWNIAKFWTLLKKLGTKYYIRLILLYKNIIRSICNIYVDYIYRSSILHNLSMYYIYNWMFLLNL